MNLEKKFGKDIQRIAQYFSKKPHIIALYLFGSSAIKDTIISRDIDIAVMFDPYSPEVEGVDFLRYSADMEGIARKKVDLVCINQSDPVLRYEILKAGCLLFERKREARIDLIVKTMRDMEEYGSFLNDGIDLIKAHFKKCGYIRGE